MGLGKSKFTFLERLTIVIPTYNRQVFALRCMQYWSGTNVNIVVIDGSEKNIDSIIVNQLEPNIKYIHDPACYYKRMLSVVDLVKTEYVLIGCDDEFYIPSAINSCIIKLSLDHELAVCGCESIGFNWKNNLVLGFSVDPKLKNLNLDDLSPADRIKKHFLDYVPAHYYSVCRTDIWKIAVKEIFSKEYSCYAIAELQLEFLMAYSGKSLIIPELMCLRSAENEQISGTSISSLQINSFDKWWLDKKYKKEKNDFIRRMERACKQIDQKNKTQYTPEIENCFDKYLKYHKRTKTNILYNFFFPLYKYFPIYFKNKIKIFFKYFKQFFFENKKLSLITCAKLMKKQNVKIDFDELRKIEKIINFFYQKNNKLPYSKNL
jgi:glycosyltransferase domain-containing protein